MHQIKKKEIQFIISVIIFFIIFFWSPQKFWEISMVPYVKTIDFFDLRYLQYLSSFYEDIFKTPKDLYTNNPMVMNYPRIWIVLSHFINIKHDIILYSIYFITFVLYGFIFFYLTKKFNSYFFIYIFYSGVSLLLLERGNVDIFIFLILYFSYFSSKTYLNYFGYILCSILKIYPSFSLLFFLNKKKPLIIIFILALIFVIYFYIIKSDAYYISLNSPKSGHASYGLLSIILNFKEHYEINIDYQLIIILNILFVLLTYYFFFKKFFSIKETQYSDFFLAGAGIFIFTFLINTHHDYRLIFLTFCIPMILKLENKTISLSYLIFMVFAFELQRLLAIFGFWGGFVSSIFKFALFYLNCFLYLDLVEKIFFKKIIFKFFNNNILK